MVDARTGSDPLNANVQLLKSSVAERERAKLRHFRIYLGKGGCHEAFAQSVYASGPGAMSRAVASVTNGLKLRLRSLRA